MADHLQGCEALGGYGNGVGPCTCGASKTPRTDSIIPSQSFVNETYLFDRCYFLPLLDLSRQLEQENADLKHDIERHLTINSGLLAEVSALTTILNLCTRGTEWTYGQVPDEIAALRAQLDEARKLITDLQMRPTLNEWRDVQQQLAEAQKDDVPLRCVIENGAIQFSVGAKIIAHAVAAHPELYDDENDAGLYKVTDPAAFLPEVLRELDRESEDGSTMLTRLLDKAVMRAIEQGAEGVEEVAAIDAAKEKPHV